jgi:hypothetical protein
VLGDLPSPREERQAGPQWGLKEMYTSISGLNTISDGTCLGVTRTINIEFIYRVFGREITRYTVIYGIRCIYTVLANPTHKIRNMCTRDCFM